MLVRGFLLLVLDGVSLNVLSSVEKKQSGDVPDLVGNWARLEERMTMEKCSQEIAMKGVAGVSRLIAPLRSSRMVYDAAFRSSSEASLSRGVASSFKLSEFPFTNILSPYILLKAWALLFLALA